MHDKINSSNILLAVIFSGLGILLPLLFHLLGLGAMFMPMYLPLAIGAFMLSRGNALMMGFFTPLASSLITGMPPWYPPVAPVMIAQLALFALVISSLAHQARWRPFPALIAAILVDRLALAGWYFFIMPLFSVNAAVYTAYDLVKSLPGIVLMLVVIPQAVPRCVAIVQRKSLRLFEHTHEEDHERSPHP